MRSPLSRRLAKIASVVGIPIAIFGLLEIGARVTGAGERERPIHEDIANWSAQWDGPFYTLPRQPGINRDGLRDYEHPLKAPKGSLRLACLGDSVTFGYNVRRKASYPAQLDDLVKRLPGGGDVLNVALPGWSLRQQRIAYQQITRKYNPDAVLLGVCLNDIPEMQNNLDRPPAWQESLLSRSARMRALLRPHDREIADVLELFEQPEAKRVRNGWRLWERELSDLHRETSSDGVPLVVVGFPFRLQVEPNAPDPGPQEKLKQICERLGIPWLDLLPVLKPVGSAAFVDYDHLSREGAMHVSNAVFGQLNELDLTRMRKSTDRTD
jgi:lysophospholipase L1-like esterase